MSRIPEAELAELKSCIDLAALVRSKGIELKAHGGKDLAGLSPFTEEKTASFIVSPGKNLWHCMSSGQGGSVIDFIMKYDGVSFREAVELLRTKSPRLYRSGGRVKKSTVPKLPAPVAFDADEEALFGQVLDYYALRLKENPAAVDCLKKRGLWNEEALKVFRIGYADRTLGLTLPHKNRKDGAAIRERLQRIGIYRESGHEHFNGSLVFPIIDSMGHVSEIYGRKVGKQKSGIDHLYLPGPHRGIWNWACLTSAQIILTESVIDALTFWVNGFKNVTCIYGTEGFTGDHLEAFKRHKTQKIYLAYDRDKAGDRAAQRDAERLGAIGIECFRVRFPAGMDANEYALKVTPAAKSLGLLLNAAEWLGKGHRSSVVAEAMPDKSSYAPEEGQAMPSKIKNPECEDAPRASSSSLVEIAANLAAQERSEEVPPQGKQAKPVGAETHEEQGAAKIKKADLKPVGDVSCVALEAKGEDYTLDLGDPSAGSGLCRSYRVRGLQKNGSMEVLKVQLRLMVHRGDALGGRSLGEGPFHLDTLDFYRAKDRECFIRTAAAETTLEAELIKRDMGKLLLALEALQQARIGEAMEPKSEAVEMAAKAKEEALELLKSPDLLGRILTDFDACGIVGEATNKLTGYLACVSRKLDRPLAVIIQSTSAAGKSMLMESILAFVPQEERVKYSAMTGQSLYYLGETNLKNKILAIVEEEGAEKASYALKLLQSEGELTIASTGKDEQGRMKTEEYHVEGPVMIFLTTTAVDIDEELLNRCLVLTVDESREQTKAIHALQREGETFDGLLRKVERERILAVHRNAQRLLQAMHVVNPFATQLTFLSDRTRTRRDHVKYLTLIRSIALLHQHQRPLKEKAGLQYIEVTLEDLAAANALAHEVLGRSLDELPPQTRRLLEHLKQMVGERCRSEAIEAELCWFTRREVREFTGWSNTQLKVHLDRLEELEYIYPRRAGMRGSAYEYELLFDGDTGTARAQLIGLINLEKLGYDQKFTGEMAGFAGPKRPQNGAFTGAAFPSAVACEGVPVSARPSEQAKAQGDEPSFKAAFGRKTPKGRNAQARDNLRVVVS